MVRGVKKRARTERRLAERVGDKLASAREKLFSLEPGGSPEQPLTVTSAAVVETHAESTPCPRCSGRHEIVEHLAVTREGRRLRETKLRCRHCGARRSMWFRIEEPFGLN